MLKPYRCHKMTVNYTVKPVVGIIVKVTRDAYKKFLAGENVGIEQSTLQNRAYSGDMPLANMLGYAHTITGGNKLLLIY